MSVRRTGLRFYVEALLVTVMMATLARTFLAQGLRIGSGSMEQALLRGDHVLVNRFVFNAADTPAWVRPLLPVRAPRRGEVIVVRLPRERRTLLVKRCVAVPGDQVELGGATTPVDGYFVLGDRRDRSYDSRSFGSVPARDVLGKPLFVYWSWRGGERGSDGLRSTVRDFGRRTRWQRTLRPVR